VDYEALLDRILRRVDADAYLPLADVVDEDQRVALDEVGLALQQPRIDVDSLRARVRHLHSQGAIDQVNLYSALHVIAAHPRVADLEEAAAMTARQEMAALRLGGPRLQGNLASVERHRGVIAWTQGNTDVAMDYFSRAFERQRSAGNLANVLACLLRLGAEADAQDLLRQVRGVFPTKLVAALDDMIQRDPDLSLLRVEASP